ncbi:unnamed protein product [Ilex paraguariensis]|uniref:O-acyltransferase WSD1 C-terminal domain-containing protein n=1 Tax=Ilex paraguariensis TaxID=185542 RepID=A0ABC8S467_9AQUA
MMKEDSKVKWGNLIGYVIVPFTIALQEDPLSYVLEAKAVMDRKKLSFEAITTYVVSKFILKIFGVKAAAAVTHKLVSNTTMAFSNVVGPQEEISLYGHPLAYIAPTFYGLPYEKYS